MRSALAIVLLIPFALAGCASKVRFEESATFTSGDDFAREIEGPSKDQKVRVEVSGASEPVNVYVFLVKDRDAADSAITASKESAPGLLGAKLNVKDAVLEVEIPAKQAFEIHLTTQAKSATAKVKAASY